jgi:hypothetical protein
VGRLASVGVPVLVGVAVVWSAVVGIGHSWSTASPASTAAWELDASYYACLAAQVHSVAPTSGEVWVSEVTPNSPQWYRTLWKVVAETDLTVTTDARGVVDLSLVTAPNGGGCLGVQVRAVYPDGAQRLGTGTLRSTRTLPTTPL